MSHRLTAQENPETDRTSGWVIFAGIIAAMAALLNLLYGFTMLFNDEWVALAPRAVISFNLTTAGAATLFLGVLQLMVALGIFNGDLWARVVGIVAAGLNVLVQMGFMSIYPQWSWLLIGVNVLLIYGLAVHGDEVAKF
jgi:lysylphosphatidylglycerol synthetase-like protein (DUF2156 family)